MRRRSRILAARRCAIDATRRRVFFVWPVPLPLLFGAGNAPRGDNRCETNPPICDRGQSANKNRNENKISMKILIANFVCTQRDSIDCQNNLCGVPKSEHGNPIISGYETIGGGCSWFQIEGVNGGDTTSVIYDGPSGCCCSEKISFMITKNKFSILESDSYMLCMKMFIKTHNRCFIYIPMLVTKCGHSLLLRFFFDWQLTERKQFCLPFYKSLEIVKFFEIFSRISYNSSFVSQHKFPQNIH